MVTPFLGYQINQIIDNKGSGAFPRTRWTLVEDLRTEGAVRERAMSELCEIYWHPVYAFLLRGGTSRVDAEDRAQGFFERLVEQNFLSSADAGKGKLRTFLLTALQRYCISEYRKETRQKRGGGQDLVSLDAEEDGVRVPEPSLGDDPEKLFEKQWAISLLDEAFTRVESEYRLAEKGRLFELLSPFLTGRQKEDPRYEELAVELEMTVGSVQVAVHRMRKRYRRGFEEVVRETVEDEALVEEEIRHVLRVLTS